jgi:single-strand DNA-binding protein
MADYNQVILVGRPVKDPDVKTVGEDRLRAMFTLAVNRPYKDNDGKSVADFINIVSWGKKAELTKEYVKKGVPILVDGSLQCRSYEQENEKKWITEIVAESYSFLNSRKKEEKST